MIENKNNNNTHSDSEKEKIDQQPLIGLFELLLEWEIKDVQEKRRKDFSSTQTTFISRNILK